MHFRFRFARLAPAMLVIFLFAPIAHSAAHSAAGSEMNLSERLKYASKFDDSVDDKKKVKEPAEIWQGLESEHWPDALQPFQARFQPGKSYLTLFKKLPRSPMDMRSPDRFKRSMGAKEIANKSSIGHMAVGWSCASDERVRDEGFAAQTGENGQQPEMLDTGWGATSLISTFTDGRLQNASEVQRYFATSYRNSYDAKNIDSFFALVIEVPLQDCERVREFVKNYVFHPSKPYRNFGMNLDPAKFEGAGCGSFAVTALAQAPTLEPLTSHFWRTIPVAEKLLGRRTRVQLPNDVVPFVYAKVAADEQEISKYQLVLMNWDSGDIALRLHVADPELTIFSIRKFAEIALAVQPGTTPFQREHLRALKRTYNFPSSPNDVRFDDKDSGYQEINSEFDPSFARVSTSTDLWWRERSAVSQIHLISFPLGVGVMVESNAP